MSFLYPLGLLGLIGVPVLILIYILKNKYTEQTVTSTYLWTLSERFLKRKNPINRINGLISLILQILAVIAASLAIAHPVFKLPGKADDYCFVLDASGSMCMQTDGKTRFERGKEQISEIISSSGNGSTYTLVVSGDSTVVVYKQIGDKKQALDLLAETQTFSGTADFTDALGESQKYFEETPSLKVYLFTDKSYQNAQNVNVVNLAANENNAALLGVKATPVGENLEVSGKAIAYGDAREVKISVYVRHEMGGEETKAGETTVQLPAIKQTIALPEAEEDRKKAVEDRATAYTVTCENMVDYQSLRVAIEGADAFLFDDEVILYNVKHDTSFETLIVSETPFFLTSVFKSMGHQQIDAVEPSEYASVSKEYGLYIFDSFVPEEIPENGAVWFFAPEGSVDEATRFIYQGTVSGNVAKELTYSTSSSTVVKQLLTGVFQDDSTKAYIAEYSKLQQTGEFTTLLSCDGQPVLFVGENKYGNREAVCAFSLHKSDMALNLNFLSIVRNLLNYTFPSVVDESNYFSGDFAQISVVPNCESIVVTKPSGTKEYLDVGTSVCEYKLDEVGMYTVTLRIGSVDSLQRVVYLYAQPPYEESIPLLSADEFSLIGEPSAISRDGIYENIIALFIILAVLLAADWMVYCYEQYQLR